MKKADAEKKEAAAVQSDNGEEASLIDLSAEEQTGKTPDEEEVGLGNFGPLTARLVVGWDWNPNATHFAPLWCRRTRPLRR